MARDQPTPRAVRLIPHSARCARSKLFGKGAGNNRSSPNATFKVAFRHKLGVSVQDREPGNTECGSQTSRRGDSLPRVQTPVNNGGAIAVVDLLVQSLRSPAVDCDDGQNPRGHSFHCGGS